MSDRPPHLGDVIDDYCPTCRLLLNHDIAAFVGPVVAKVTCRTCFNTHDFRNAQVPAKRKGKKEEPKSLVDQVLATLPPPPVTPAAPMDAPPPRKRRDLWAEVKRIQEQQQKKS
jgi:hypothetical protein